MKVWGKVKDLFEYAKDLYEKIKGLVKAGIELTTKVVDNILDQVRVTKVEFKTSLKAAATAEIELTAIVGNKEYKIEAFLRGNFLQKVAEVVIEKMHEGFLSLKDGFIEAREYINKMVEKIGTVEKELATAEENKGLENPKKRSYVPTEKEFQIKRFIYDPLPRPELHDYKTVNVFENFEPNAFMSVKDSLPTERVSKIKDNNPAKKYAINGMVTQTLILTLQQICLSTIFSVTLHV